MSGSISDRTDDGALDPAPAPAGSADGWAAPAGPDTGKVVPTASPAAFPRPRLAPGEVRRLGIDTGPEPVLYLHRDSPICRSEGFGAHSRVELRVGERRLLATLNTVDGRLLGLAQAGLSESAWAQLQPQAHESVMLAHPASVDSLAAVRAKIFGAQLDAGQWHAIVRDIVDHRFANLELAALITACSGDRLSVPEVIALTAAMVDTGARLHWPQAVVADKHCIGGLAGNRTTPIVVAIAAELGLTMPKTSSRAITSAAGTADTMAMLAPVELDQAAVRQAVATTGGCIVWGGSMNLSPADDILIRIEHILDIDSVGQMVASVLSKKIAAGSTHVVIDIPVGPTAKVRDRSQAQQLEALMLQVAKPFGLHLHVVISDGTQPIGRGIGPALEAHDVLAVLRNRPDAPQDLRQHALALASALLELTGVAGPREAATMARDCLASGRAWSRFQAICAAQGGMREPGVAAYRQPVVANAGGRVTAIDNRRLSRAAKLAGAPSSPLAGLTLDVHLGDCVTAGQPVFTLHAQSPGELAYALEYVSRHPDIIALETPA